MIEAGDATATAEAASSSEREVHAAAEEKQRECPICKMMRDGGCKDEFDAFMDCGVDAEKGQRDYGDCIAAFEVMRNCMVRNKEAFGDMLQDMDVTGSTGAAEDGGADIEAVGGAADGNSTK